MKAWTYTARPRVDSYGQCNIRWIWRLPCRVHIPTSQRTRRLPADQPAAANLMTECGGCTVDVSENKDQAHVCAQQ